MYPLAPQPIIASPQPLCLGSHSPRLGYGTSCAFFLSVQPRGTPCCSAEMCVCWTEALRAATAHRVWWAPVVAMMALPSSQLPGHLPKRDTGKAPVPECCNRTAKSVGKPLASKVWWAADNTRAVEASCAHLQEAGVNSVPE